MRRLSVQLSRIEETAAAMRPLYQQRKIRAIGVSNYSLEQMNVFQHVPPLHTARYLVRIASQLIASSSA
jgi:diketogulonate reductase-like aldo/keto reductase